MSVDPSTTKYVIKARLNAEGVVEKPDVVGAIFGQTEGLLGDELDLRDLQKTGRMGRIEVEVLSKKGRSEGTITMPSSLDQVETAILAAALETIDRVGPCKAEIKVTEVEDVRIVKKQRIVDRAKVILKGLIEDNKTAGSDISDSVRQAVQVEEIVSFGPDKCPAGPNVAQSDAIIVVEGRSDVLNLLKYGIKNSVAVEGTNVPKTIQDLTREKSVTVFLDGDRGGDLILKELLQVAEIDFVARAPRNREVEELTQKQIMKALRNKMPTDQYVEVYGFKNNGGGARPPEASRTGQPPPYQDRGRRDDRGKPPRDKFREKPYSPAQQEAPPVHPPQPQPPPEKPRGGLFSSFVDKVKRGGRLSESQVGYKKMLDDLSGSFKANLLDQSGKVISEIPVRDLAETLKSPPAAVHTVVFDGVVSQRILDIASEKDIKVLVGVKLGNVTKAPTKIDVFTKADLE